MNNSRELCKYIKDNLVWFSSLHEKLYQTRVDLLKDGVSVYKYQAACFSSLGSRVYENGTIAFDSVAVIFALPNVNKEELDYLRSLLTSLGTFDFEVIPSDEVFDLAHNKPPWENAEVLTEEDMKGVWIRATFFANSTSKLFFYLMAQLLRMQQEIPYWCKALLVLGKEFPHLTNWERIYLSIVTKFWDTDNYIECHHEGHHPFSSFTMEIPEISHALVSYEGPCISDNINNFSVASKVMTKVLEREEREWLILNKYGYRYSKWFDLIIEKTRRTV